MSTVDFGGTRWRKSSRSSGGDNEDCVEVAHMPRVAAVRDSKNPAGPVLTFPETDWSGFLSSL